MPRRKRTFCQREIKRLWRRQGHQGTPPEKPAHWRPTKRSECIGGPRPCLYVGCRHHLFLEVTSRGGLKAPYGLEPEALATMKETCALDVADRGAHTLNAVAEMHLLTRERVRQIEVIAMDKMRVWAEDEKAHLGAGTARPLLPGERHPVQTTPKPRKPRVLRPKAPAATAAAEPPAGGAPPSRGPEEESRLARARQALAGLAQWAGPA